MMNLLLAIEESLELGYVIDTIFTDFEKALDSVPHQRLLVKLESIWIQGDILQWV